MDSFKQIVFDLKQMCRPQARRLQRELMHTQFLSSDELQALNWKRRLALLRAAETAPFYKRRFQSIGMNVGDVKTEADYEKIPIVTRRDIQEHKDDFIPKGVDKTKLAIASTGGSTGEPLKLWRPKHLPYDAFTACMLSWWRISMAENSAYIFRHGYKGSDKLVNDLKWFPTQRVFLNAAQMTDERCDWFYRRCCDIRPVLLVGYVGAIAQFADFLEARNLDLPPSLRAVWTTAAPLPESLRSRLESVYHSPVLSQYGCCEMGHLAAECAEKKGLHIHSDWRHLEIVDMSDINVAVGQTGRIVVTDMLAKETPLIRYEIGDQGRLLSGHCVCGCRLPLLDTVKGRVSDNFVLPDGSLISGEYLTTIFDDCPEIVSNFRVVQHENYSVEVLYVPRSCCSEDALGIVKKHLQVLLRDQVPVEFVAVKEIEHNRGKMRFIETHVERQKKSDSA